MVDHGDRTAQGVWLLLMAASIVTTWGLSKDKVPDQVATVFTVLIAAWKARLVLLHFMELRHAPWVPRLIFEAWLLLAAGVILVPYFLTPAA